MTPEKGSVVCSDLGVPGLVKIVEDPGSNECAGYTLIGIIQETRYSESRDGTACSQDGQRKNIIEFGYFTTTTYIMRKSESSSVLELAEKIKDFRDSEKRTRVELSEKCREIKGLKKKIGTEKDRRDYLESRVERLQKERDRFQGENYSMSADMKKIVDALGKIRVNDVLGKES
jgi:hypothetical protein